MTSNSHILQAEFFPIGRWELSATDDKIKADIEQSAENCLYAFVINREATYVGLTARTVKARMQNIRNAGDSQDTNIFLEDEIKRILKAKTPIEIYVHSPEDNANLEVIKGEFIRRMDPIWNRRERWHADSEEKEENTANPDFTREETIFLLAFYFTHCPIDSESLSDFPSKESPEIQELSRFLRSLGEKRGQTVTAKYRNTAGVHTSLRRFHELHPSHEKPKGLGKPAVLAREILEEFDNDPVKIQEECDKLLIQILDDEDELYQDSGEASEKTGSKVREGQAVVRIHRFRERNNKIVADKKWLTLRQQGCLRCEVCGFDFHEKYGDRGKDFIECHHTKPLSQTRIIGEETSLNDLALLCANCHRMIHRQKPWLTVEQLRDILSNRQ